MSIVLYVKDSTASSSQSSLLLLNEYLCIHRRCAETADVPACGFVEIRLPGLLAVRAADNERFIVLMFRHEVVLFHESELDDLRNSW